MRVRAGLIALALAAAPQTAFAWKPNTHVYLAERALSDAVDDGKVTVYEISHGRIVGVLGRFDVDPATLRALRTAPAQYRAGVLGPDAYPDILTGQQIVHPDVARPVAAALTGSDGWLTHLWRTGAAKGPQVRAFAAGYLTHAAGDVFAHTYVNHYAGGEFTLDPAGNAARHILLESYLGKRTPERSTGLPVSIAGVEDFIRDEMTIARPGSVLADKLMIGEGTFSIPYRFSRLRNDLQGQVEAYEAELRALPFAQQQALRVRRGAQTAYARAWIADIDRGLAAWPGVSDQIARAVVYPAGGADFDAAQKAMEAYARKHLWSMAGAPDWTVGVAYAPSDLATALLPEPVRNALEQIVRAPLDLMVRSATGLSIEQWKGYLKNPELWFDPVMNAADSTGKRITLTEFNRTQLKIADAAFANPAQRWKVEDLPPAFNTVQLSKLALLGHAGQRQLAAALAARGAPIRPPTEPGANLMLGWVRSLDAGNQWQGLPSRQPGPSPRPAFAASRAAYGKLFLPQLGEAPLR